MTLMIDTTADQPPLPGRLAVQDLASEEVASLAEELVTYHQHASLVVLPAGATEVGGARV